jgi:hypothetical protein
LVEQVVDIGGSSLAGGNGGWGNTRRHGGLGLLPFAGFVGDEDAIVDGAQQQVVARLPRQIESLAEWFA